MKKTLNDCMDGSLKCTLNNCDSYPQCPPCRPLPSPICCQGYPVSIHCVRSLGNKSLMVYWIVHDFRDISGYEVSTFGYHHIIIFFFLLFSLISFKIPKDN